MKKPYSIITFLIIMFSFSNIIYSQINLVPNPGFEEYISCPDDYGEFDRVKYWFNTTLGTPDYYNACSITKNPDVPNNNMGYQYARTGAAYVGIFTASDSIYPNYREYIAAKLLNILSAEKKYKVEFYVSLSDSSNLAADGFGIYFSI